MNDADKTLLLTAILLATITLSAIYLSETDPETIENMYPLNVTYLHQSTLNNAITFDFIDLTDPEDALSHGIPGYVEVTYIMPPPETTIISPGENVTYLIQFQLISYSENLTETIIALAPEKGIGGSYNGITLSDYVSYEPTVFILKTDQTITVSMTYSVEEDAEHGFSVPSDRILGVGMRCLIPVKGGHPTVSAKEDLSWAYQLLENGMEVTPAWLMVNRFEATNETLIDVLSIDLEAYPRLREAFALDERYTAMGAPHPGEWVECTSEEALSIVNLFGGEITHVYGFPSVHVDFMYQGQGYSLTLSFSPDAPPIF